jgi:DNA polymerase III subunit alpha
MILARSYSHHSLLSAVPKIPVLIQAAKERGYTALALTDEETCSGLLEFYEACKKAEIKPILGSVVKTPNLLHQQAGVGRHKEFSKIGILAKNQQGYLALLKLVSIARTEQENPAYHIRLDNISKVIEQFGDNFIITLTGNDHEIGELVRQQQWNKVTALLQKYSQVIQPKNIIVEHILPFNGEDTDEIMKLNLKLLEITQSLNIKTILSPAPRYIKREDEEVFKVVLAVRDGKRLSEITLFKDYSLPSVEELKKQYPDLAHTCDTSELEAEIDIQIRTDYETYASEAFFPKFIMPAEQNGKDRLIWESYIGLLTLFHPNGFSKKEWKEQWPYDKLDELRAYCRTIKPDHFRLFGYSETYWENDKIIAYCDRLEYELDIIITKGYPEYFLVFGDIMEYCREHGIVINTRGSAAGSLVGYTNSINILDPLLYIIPFERFLNPLRPSAPDIDGDFADDRREEVIHYIKEKYGAHCVSQIITFGTMLPRAAVRDVGRALGVSYKKCDQLAKLIPIAPQGRKATFAWAIETSEEFKQVYEQDEESNRLINIGMGIEGNYRHASCHAAGLLITPTPLTDYTALQWDTEHKMIVAQYDMRVCEKVGLVKMDILGIRNLAILGNALELAQKRREKEINLLNIDTNDVGTYDMLTKGRTIGTFQLSGAAMTKYLIEMGPTKVQDLMAMVALYRPGPMDSIPEYIRRKKKPNLIEYLVPQMREWMEASYGIFVYQEDLLMTAINLAGYDWGMADKLRKGMGKKIQKVIDEQHPIFVKGCIEHSQLDEATAEHIWSLMVPFGAYGFNKAHSSSYGMVAYWTAYMKANYTAEFMTALMTAEASNLDKIARAINECQEMNIQVLPPDINKSYYVFTIDNDQTIRYGLSSVKNLGRDVIHYLIEERERDGKFTSIDDLLNRMSSCQGFNKRSLEALIWSGSLDELGEKVLYTQKPEQRMITA